MPPRPLRPKDEPGVPDGSDPAADSKVSKRRAVSSACIPCRKRKSKCDGNLPSCSTCIAVYRTECYYDSDGDHRRKGALRRDIKSVHQQNDALDVILASLRTLPEDEAIVLLHNLRNDSDFDALAASLRNNVHVSNNSASHALDADFARRPSHSAPNSASTEQASQSLSRSREHSMDGSSMSNDMMITTENSNSNSWLGTAQDSEFVDHLLNLYFTWVHPFYHFFSRERFLRDMHQGRTEFCSPILFNAVMALACHYSDRPSARSEHDNPATAGDLFFTEAKRMLDQSDRSSLTVVQALGVMSVRECSQGRDSKGYQYAGRAARMALELGLHLSAVTNGLSAAEVEMRKITFWAVFNVETICSVGFGRLSQLPRAAADIQKPTVNEQADTQPWRPYEDTNLLVSPSVEQAARPMLFIEQLSKLCELACDMVNTFYAPQERFTSRRLVAAYNQYQQWHRNLPDAFRLENTNLPHVLVLHMYYYACVLHLFRPYIKLDLRGANLFPRDTCTFCANEISALMNALRAMYGLRRVCLAVANLLLSASTIHLLNLPGEPAASYLSQGLHDLQTMSTNHIFAGRCVDIVRSLATRWNITLPENAAAVAAFRGPGPTTGLSPPISQFFVPVISPQQSSDSGTKSSSAGSQQQSPFGASPAASQNQQPQHQYQHPQQLQQQFQPFHNDAMSAVDPPNAVSFWTPFPGQSMPMPPEDAHLPDKFSPVDQQLQQNWAMLGQQGRHHSAPTGMRGSSDENMEGGAGSWNWQ